MGLQTDILHNEASIDVLRNVQNVKIDTHHNTTFEGSKHEGRYVTQNDRYKHPIDRLVCPEMWNPHSVLPLV